MKTQIVSMDEKKIDMEMLRKAGEIIKKGGLVAFPTETVYGLGADGTNPAAVRRSTSAGRCLPK